jgi:hypothetical protein
MDDLLKDLQAICPVPSEVSSPTLSDEIARRYPSFPDGKINVMTDIFQTEYVFTSVPRFERLTEALQVCPKLIFDEPRKKLDARYPVLNEVSRSTLRGDIARHYPSYPDGRVDAMTDAFMKSMYPCLCHTASR